MAKQFCVILDITMAKNIYVEAEDEEHAMSKVREMINKNPYDYTSGFSHYVGYNVVDAVEED